jgi:hypothetical protein
MPLDLSRQIRRIEMIDDEQDRVIRVERSERCAVTRLNGLTKRLQIYRFPYSDLLYIPAIRDVPLVPY